ncbi:aromatic acid exporter family protein [Streptococcus didelphis]|uniref:Aromatic acid exporter family protein n=1 Tax=Streptococcus didelphis TaxID=102886 RepID=A0ABY9LFT5_9STRE|nr:aromatic acid exporter family protein [Streptococcus didelphis]WMB27775.1 aromatic acid exporter family protein [Streptococcus didelphis]WMB29765.1 aromatic acid exporter family protein [Streptococcus didelphis]
MNYYFDPKKLRLGMRTFKTGLSVFLVIFLFHLFGFQGVQIGALTAVFSLRESIDKTLSFGTSRILGNSIGGIFALVFYFMQMFFNHDYWVTLIFIPILTMLTIMFNVAFNNKSGVIGAVAALLIITLSIPRGDTFVYVLARVFETFCGVFIAILVNTDIEWIQQKIEKRKKKD